MLKAKGVKLILLNDRVVSFGISAFWIECCETNEGERPSKKRDVGCSQRLHVGPNRL